MRPVFTVALAIALLAAAVDARHAFSRPGTPRHHGFALALDRVAQEISGRRNVSARCGATSDPPVLGAEMFYGGWPHPLAPLSPPGLWPPHPPLVASPAPLPYPE